MSWSIEVHIDSIGFYWCILSWFPTCWMSGLQRSSRRNALAPASQCYRRHGLCGALWWGRGPCHNFFHHGWQMILVYWYLDVLFMMHLVDFISSSWRQPTFYSVFFISSLKGRLKCLGGRVIALEHKSEQATGCWFERLRQCLAGLLSMKSLACCSTDIQLDLIRLIF